MADGLIAEIASRVTESEHVIDARGNVVTPGLIDAHFHAYGVSVHNFDFEQDR